MLPCGSFGIIHTHIVFLAIAVSLHVFVQIFIMMHTEHDQVYLHTVEVYRQPMQLPS